MSLKPTMYLSAEKSIDGTTSTGNGLSIPTPALTVVAAQVVVNGTGTGSFLVQGSLDGTTWSNIIAATTYANNRLVRSSTIGPVAFVRAVVTAHGSTKDVSIWLSGR